MNVAEIFATAALGAYLLAFILAGSVIVARTTWTPSWPLWLRLTPTKDLLRQSIMAQVDIHIMPDLTRKTYASKLVGLPTPTIAKVVESVIAAGMDLGVQHGIQVHVCSRPDHKEMAK